MVGQAIMQLNDIPLDPNQSSTGPPRSPPSPLTISPDTNTHRGRRLQVTSFQSMSSRVSSPGSPDFYNGESPVEGEGSILYAAMMKRPSLVHHASSRKDSHPQDSQSIQGGQSASPQQEKHLSTGGAQGTDRHSAKAPAIDQEVPSKAARLLGRDTTHTGGKTPSNTNVLAPQPQLSTFSANNPLGLSHRSTEEDRQALTPAGPQLYGSTSRKLPPLPLPLPTPSPTLDSAPGTGLHPRFNSAVSSEAATSPPPTGFSAHALLPHLPEDDSDSSSHTSMHNHHPREHSDVHPIKDNTPTPTRSKQPAPTKPHQRREKHASLLGALRSHPPDPGFSFPRRSNTVPYRPRRANFAEDLNVDTQRAKQFRGNVVGTPYPHDGAPQGEEEEDEEEEEEEEGVPERGRQGGTVTAPQRGPSKRDGGIWARFGRGRRHGPQLKVPVESDEADGKEDSASSGGKSDVSSISPTPEPGTRARAGALEPGTSTSTSHRKQSHPEPSSSLSNAPNAPKKRADSSPRPPVPPKTKGKQRTSTEVQLTVLVRHPATHIVRSTTLTGLADARSDDESLGLALRSAYASLRGKWRGWLSARGLAHVQILRPGAGYDWRRRGSAESRAEVEAVLQHGLLPTLEFRDPTQSFSSALTQLVLAPARGRGEVKMLGWARSNKRVGYHPGTTSHSRKVSENISPGSTRSMSLAEILASEAGAPPPARVVEIIECWSAKRILVALACVLSLSVLTALLWILAGPGGASVAPPSLPGGSSVSTSLLSLSSPATPTSSTSSIGVLLDSGIVAQPTLGPGLPSAPLLGSVGPIDVSPTGVPELASAIFTALPPTGPNLPEATLSFGLGGRKDKRQHTPPGNAKEDVPPQLAKNETEVHVSTLLSPDSQDLVAEQTHPQAEPSFQQIWAHVEIDAEGHVQIVPEEQIHNNGKAMAGRDVRVPVDSPDLASRQVPNDAENTSSDTDTSQTDTRWQDSRDARGNRVAGGMALAVWILLAGGFVVVGWLAVSWLAG